MGISQYSAKDRAALREYFHFANELGSHRFIYEEAELKPPLQGIAGMRGVMGNSQMLCSVDLECKTKAFCTGRCQNMYYELSNFPDDPALVDRNSCRVLTLKCNKTPGAP
jgi:hypothetical protein